MDAHECKHEMLTINVCLRMKVPVKRDSAGRRICPPNLIANTLDRIAWSMQYPSVDGDIWAPQDEGTEPFELGDKEQFILFSLMDEAEDWRKEYLSELAKQQKADLASRMTNNPWLKKSID
jgi:hypothetical protein